MALTCTWDAGVVVCHIFQSLLYLALHFIKRLTWLGGNHVYVCVCTLRFHVFTGLFFLIDEWNLYLWKMYTDISVSIKCDICNLSQKNMNIWSCIHKCLLHSWRYNYSNSSSTPFDTNVIRDCVILLSQRCHLNILSPIGTLSQRRRKKKKKVILISNQSYLKCNPVLFTNY